MPVHAAASDVFKQLQKIGVTLPATDLGFATSVDRDRSGN